MKLIDLKIGQRFKFKNPSFTSEYVVADDHGFTVIFSLTNSRVHSYYKYKEEEVELI